MRADQMAPALLLFLTAWENFSLPVGQGTWQVRTILYEPTREGEAVIVNITPSEPSPKSINLAPPAQNDQKD
jgi:hypothetical protein